MKKVILSGVIAAMIFGFAGCNNQTVNTVDYYKTHDTEREAKITECKNNPGGMKDDPNCINAFVAHSQGGIKPHVHPTDNKTMDDFMPPYKKQ
jgi:outer membrane lipoprotein SlyB